MMMLAGLALALATTASADATTSSTSSVSTVVTVGGARYRVQALSPTLLRLEAEGPSGDFENRSTFFAQNRSWGGVPITAHADGGNSTTLSTASWSLELSAEPLPDSVQDLGAESVGTTTCGNALEGSAVAEGAALGGSAPVSAAAAPTSCCAACDAATGCTAWVWIPAAPAPPPHHGGGGGGGGGKGPLRAAPCDAKREGQTWKLAGKRGDNSWTSIESGNGKNGCWEITGCARGEGAHVGTSYGCKPVPKPGYSNDCAANGAWVAHANGTITSVIDGHCLTLGSDKKSLEVDSCVAGGSKSQQWIFDQAWTKSGSGKPSSVRSAVDATEGGDGSSAGGAGICIDNGPEETTAAPAAVAVGAAAPPPASASNASSCQLYSSVTSIKSGGPHNSVLGGVHPATPYQKGRGCAATLKSADGSVLWSSPSFGASSPTLSAPAPSLVSNTTVLAVIDAPRFVPPPWGATPPPSYIDAASLPYANTSGFDLTNHADDLYLFISSDNHAEGLTGMRKEFLQLSGHVPLLPQWAFGLWFTWYHPYNQSEKTAEIQRFIDDDLGLDVASLDRNWRLYGGGTGPGPLEGLYQENKTLLPDLDGFFDWVHQNNVHVFFNDHPKPLSYGENRSAPAVIPPGEGPLGPKETAFRWDGLTSLLARGLDFWWYDCHWAWSAPSIKVDGSSAAVDGTTWGQAVLQDVTARFMANGTNGSSMRGPGRKPSGDDVTPFQMGCAESNHPTSHRYSVHWTGDIFSEDLIGSVSNTIMGGIEGFKPYVHPDCTAHHNYDEPEVYVRWIQFCSLSNIFRVHSDPFNDRRPWSFGNATGNATDDPTEGIFRNFSHMRLQMLPMLATAAVHAASDGTPLVKRLDFAFPTEVDATRQDQYLFLDSMLVAPVNPFVNGSKPWTEGQTGVDPKTPGSFNRTREVWVPPGAWEDAYSGKTVQGPQLLTRSAVPLTETILYHRRPSLAVTARKQSSGQNAATTDITNDLIIEAFPSTSLPAAEGEMAAGAGAVLTRREVLSGSAATALLEMVEHPAGSDAALAHCASDSPAPEPTEGAGEQQRLITLTARDTAEGNGDEEEEGRRWLVRVHLSPNETLQPKTNTGNDNSKGQERMEIADGMRTLSPLEEGAAQTAPLGGEGARPSSQAGHVVELKIAAVAGAGGERREQQVKLCVGATGR